jgi:hypothetical protein
MAHEQLNNYNKKSEYVIEEKSFKRLFFIELDGYDETLRVYEMMNHCEKEKKI